MRFFCLMYSKQINIIRSIYWMNDILFAPGWVLGKLNPGFQVQLTSFKSYKQGCENNK